MLSQLTNEQYKYLGLIAHWRILNLQGHKCETAWGQSDIRLNRTALRVRIKLMVNKMRRDRIDIPPYKETVKCLSTLPKGIV